MSLLHGWFRSSILPYLSIFKKERTKSHWNDLILLNPNDFNAYNHNSMLVFGSYESWSKGIVTNSKSLTGYEISCSSSGSAPRMMIGLSKDQNITTYSVLSAAIYRSSTAFYFYSYGTNKGALTPIYPIDGSEECELAIRVEGLFYYFSIDGYEVASYPIPPDDIGIKMHSAILGHSNATAKYLDYRKIDGIRNRQYIYANSRTIYTKTATPKPILISEPQQLQQNKAIEVSLHIPLRKDSTSWGGAYIIWDILINGTWYGLGNNGYDGNIMQTGASAIATWTSKRTIDVYKISGLPKSTIAEYQVRISFTHYNVTAKFNASHDLDGTSRNQREFTLSTAGSQHYLNYGNMVIAEIDASSAIIVANGPSQAPTDTTT